MFDSMSPQEVVEFKASAVSRAERDGYKSPPIVAKGDSWFDFLPGTDLIDCLRDLRGLRISNYSRAGDTLENMILGSSVDEEGRSLGAGVDACLPELRRVLPRFFLFSGGGNDVAGSEFSNYLNHKRSGLEILRERVVEELFDRVFRAYFEILLSRVWEASPNTIIVTHGYGHAVPTGRGTKVLGFTFAGPWLLPSLQSKGIDFAEGAKIVRILIDRYNDLLQSLENAYPDRFRYVDLRAAINTDDWRDELHLKNSAYSRMAELIAQRLD